MRRTIALAFLASLALHPPASAAQFKPYPGAAVDSKASKEAADIAKEAGMTGKTTIYTTRDPFEKVCAFYKGMAKEYKMPQEGGTARLPSGQELKEAYFIFDGARDIAVSKLWIKIQRPYVGGMEIEKDFQVRYKDVRDVTAVTVSEHK